MIVLGTVGWEGDDGVHFNKGSEENDGHTFIKVQTIYGKDPSKKLNPDVGQGNKIWTKLSSHIYRIPPPGTQVYVAIPEGMEAVVGAGAIIATIEKSPTIQFEDDRAVIDYGPDTHVVIKGASVSLSDHDNRFITVGSPRSGGDPGIIFQDDDGTGGVISNGTVSWFASDGPGGTATAFLQVDDGEIKMATKGSSNSLIKLDTNFTVLAKSGFLTCGTTVVGVGAGTYLPPATALLVPATSLIMKV